MTMTKTEIQKMNFKIAINGRSDETKATIISLDNYIKENIVTTDENGRIIMKDGTKIKYGKFIDLLLDDEELNNFLFRKWQKKIKLQRKDIGTTLTSSVGKQLRDGFFRNHKEGVVNMSLTEFNEEEFVANRRVEGLREGLVKVAINMLKKHRTYEDISEMTELSVDEIKEIEKSLLVTN